MSKCCYMYFQNLKRVEHIESGDYELQINDVPIKHVHSARFLGVIIDYKLWNHHFDYLINKLKCQTGILNRNIKDCVPVQWSITGTCITLSLNPTCHIVLV